MCTSRRFLGCASAVMVAALAATAHADKAAAEAAFAEAKRLIAAGKIVDACPKFEVSFNEDPQLGTLLNLADCHEKIGKLATAWAEFKAAIELAQRSKDKRQKFARERRDMLDDRISHLVIHQKKGASGVKVTLDERDVTAMIGISVPIDPGEHEVVATATGLTESRQTVNVDKEGSKVDVTVPGADAVPVRAEPDRRDEDEHERDKVQEPAPPEPRGGGGGTRRVIGIAAMTSGLVAAGIGLYFGRQAFAKWDDSHAFCDNNVCDPQGAALVDDANSAALKANLLVGIGGGVVVVGAILWFTAPSERRASSVSLRPLVTPTVAGGSLAVSF